MIVKDEILKHSTDFKALCQTHNVKYLYAFGSSTTDNFNSEKSDIDLLVEIDAPDPLERGEKLLSLWDTFESFFHRKVDLLTESSIKNPYLRKSIDATKILIYDGKGLKYLYDILHAIELIEEFTTPISNYNDYVSDLKTQSAVERQLGIIGEAVNKFDSIHPDLCFENSQKIVGFRNRLIHAYDAVDSSMVWVIIKRHLSPLKEEINKRIQ